MVTENPNVGRWESRWHPLRQEWVIIAAHRQERPWSGRTSVSTLRETDRFDTTCFLCPGNTRIRGAENPDYSGVYVFGNDHPCVGIDAPRILDEPTGIYRNRPATGVSRVLCFSERHDLTLAQMSHQQILAIARTWQSEYQELGAVDGIDHVLIFENKGEIVGVSNPHPHGQIYATNFVFKTTEVEVQAGVDHFAATGRYLFSDIVQAEIQDEKRIICQNDSALAFIPYFGRYAYEVYVAPRRNVPSIDGLTAEELKDFVAILREVVIRFDNLWKMSFPYLMVLHNAPTDGQDYSTYHFHIQFHPPLRKPGILKYLAGPEIGGGNFLSDTLPTEKAAELRAVSRRHYLVP